MQIEDLLKRDGTAIKAHWLELIIETYPPDSREFFKNKKDRFQNPVGTALKQQVDLVYDGLINDQSDDELTVIMEEFIKIRSVQEFPPSTAIGFILFLKEAIRNTLSVEIDSHGLHQELTAFELKVDRLLLLAFDLYTRLKEKMSEIRANELKRRSFMALRMMESSAE